MHVIKAILKSKLFYIVVVIAFLINQALEFNKRYNNDLVKKYYSRSASVGINVTASENIRDSIVAYAKDLLGISYSYGAKGPSSFDCSGFTVYVFKNFGLHLPATAAMQSQYGQERQTKDVQKADLLFFRGTAREEERVGHVGIVVANENGSVSFIHSSTSRGVVIDNLDQPHFKIRYLGARNVLGVNH